MSSTMWIIVAVIGLLLIVIPNLLGDLPPCPLTNGFTSISGFIMCVSFFMAATTFFTSNQVLAGCVCAVLVVLFAILTYELYSLANNSDERDAQEADEPGAEHSVRDEYYPDENPGA